MKTNTEALKKEAIFKAARLINGVDLSLLFSICEGQKTIRTTKVLEHLERAHEGMKDCGVLMRKLSDALPFERNPLAERVKELEQIEAENARLREELNALKETQENVEATHRLTLREVQAELMRVQTKIDVQELEQQLAASQAFDAEWLHDDGENLSAYNKAKAIFCRAEKRLNASQIALRIKNEEHKCCTEDLIALRKQLHKARRGD